MYNNLLVLIGISKSLYVKNLFGRMENLIILFNEIILLDFFNTNYIIYL